MRFMNKKGFGPFGLGFSAFRMIVILIAILLIILAVRAFLFKQMGGIFS